MTKFVTPGNSSMAMSAYDTYIIRWTNDTTSSDVHVMVTTMYRIGFYRYDMYHEDM